MIEAEKIKKKERLLSLLREVAGSFIRFEVDPDALVTAMRVELSKDASLARIFISVFPENKEKEIVGLLNKKKNEMKEYLKKETKLKVLPYVEFEIDKAIKMEREMDKVLPAGRQV